MYPITDTILQKFQSGNMQYISMTGTGISITNANIMQGSCSINRYVETNESVAIGSTVAAELSFVLNNYNGEWNNTTLDGKELKVQVGVMNGNSVSYVDMGYFIIDEVNKGKNTITVAALDRMVKFDLAVDSSQFTFPYTLTNFLSRLCTLCSVTKGTFTLTNSSYSISALPSEAKTYRDLLRWVCELSGSNAYISYDGKLYLGWYGTTSQFTTTTANRLASEIDENTFTITGVTIITGDNVKYTAGTNARPITINNNPFITTQFQSVCNTLNTKLGGFSYCPFSATLLPSPQLFPMDRGTFTKADGTNVAVSISEVTFKLNGNTEVGCKGEMAVRGRTYGLADQTFYANNIAAGAITADKISAGAVTTNALAVNAVTADKIDSSVDMATNAGVAATYATKAAAAGSTQRIYYRTSSSTAPTAPSSWVTSTSTANNTWSTKRMQYDSTYKYLWTCIQTKTVSGSVSNSTVLLDDTTTVIDGGNIITGSVTANKISVSDLNALNATIANWHIGTDALYREVTISGTTYRVELLSPTSVSGNTPAFRVKKKASGSSTYTDVATIQYDGKVVSKDFEAIGAVRIAPDYDLQEQGVYAIELDDGYGVVTQMNPDFMKINGEYGGWHVDESNAKLNYDYHDSYPHKEYYVGSENYGTDSTSDFYITKITKASSSASTVTNEMRLSVDDLTFSGDSLVRLTPHLAQMWSTVIPANADLNTLTYLSVGQYFCSQNTTVQTLTNCPTSYGFNMTVEAAQSNSYDDEGSAYKYRVRKITDYRGDMWVQYAYVGATAGAENWTYYAWKKIYNSDVAVDNVTQTATTSSGDYRVLLSNTADSTTRTEGSLKSDYLTFNPAAGEMRLTRYNNSTANKYAYLYVGNALIDNTDMNCVAGAIGIYGKSQYRTLIYNDDDNALTQNRSLYLPNASGTIALKEDTVQKSGDTMTGGLTVTNSDIKISGVSGNRVMQIETTSGIRTSFYVNTSVNQGIYSNGYGTSLTDSSAVNVASADGLWIIRRGSNGSVYIPEWGGIGSSGNPVYIDSNGRPVSMSGSDIVNGLSTATAASQRDDYIVTQAAGGGTSNTTYYRRALKNVFKALNSSDVTTALGYTPPQQDTTYTSKAAVSGGTDVSLVTTGEKYTWNSKTSNTGTVTSVAVTGSKGVSVSGSPITTSGTIDVSISTSSGTATRNTTNTSAGEVKYTKYGRVVTIYTTTQITITSTGAATGKTYFSGLPKPAAATTFTGTGAGNKAVALQITTDGYLQGVFNAPPSGVLTVGHTYISAS